MEEQLTLLEEQVENKEKVDIENNRVKLEPLDWRWSAAIVGLIKYFDYHNIKYDMDEDSIEFDKSEIDDEKYLMFVEDHFSDSMQI